MESVDSVSFGDQNSGFQIVTNNAPITAQINPPDLDHILPMVHGAAFDSYNDQHENECLPGTRTDVLRQIKEWAFSPSSRCIFWLNGMAGTGKSTIARTVAASFSRTYKSLGASFFFKRGEADRASAIRLFPTIVRQLAMRIPQILPCVQKIVHDNPEIVTKTMKEQFDKLLFQPLLSLKLSGSIRTWIIVIDALDECEPDSDIRLMLQLLPQLQKVGSIRLRVFLTSRPELALELGFSRIANDHTDMVLHNIPKGDIEHDISLFFDHQLSEIRTERHLPLDWPGETNIQKLVALSLPLFISAVTICRVLHDPIWDPQDSLNEILAHQNDASHLAGMYLPVLNRLLRGQSEKQRDKLIYDFRQIIGTIVVLESPLSVASLSKLLNLPEKHIRLRLSPLLSVLSVPEDKLPVRLHHLSFRDFLLAPEARKTPFGIDEKAAHCHLTLECLSTCQNLRKNICGLSSDESKRARIGRQVTIYLSRELQYACRYWARHLSKCTEMRDILSNALSFLRIHFLHWVEVMSILGHISEVIGAIQILQKATGNKHSGMAEFLHDANRFVLKNRHIAEEAPLQLYCSGLIFAPQSSVIRRQFLESLECQSDLPTWMDRLPQVEKNWSAGLQVLEGHSGLVTSVVFSPSGQLLASGSDDKTVRLWETATGTLLHILSGHLGGIGSIAFSPNSQLLVSGSMDGTVRLWETTTGALQQTIEAPGEHRNDVSLMLPAHSEGIGSVAFSPNGRLLATGSNDGTARVWDIATGTLLQTLELQTVENGFCNVVNPVVFSPNSRQLAVGSTGKDLWLWDITTNHVQQVLEDEYESCWPVTFSPDGHLLSSSYIKRSGLWTAAVRGPGPPSRSYSSLSRLITVSSDRRLLASYSGVVYVWDTTTGALQQTLKGHLNYIESITFSPDGRLLASGSADQTVRLWDTTMDTLQHPLKGHSERLQSPEYYLQDARSIDPQQIPENYAGSVLSVAFSFDGRLLASSIARKVQLWDVTTGFMIQTLHYTGSVNSIAFSPVDGVLAFASNSLRLWDMMTGRPYRTMEQYPAHLAPEIKSLAFSLDGRLFASSSDKTIKLWDTMTGRIQHIFEGHSKHILSATFSVDGQLLASSSFDRTIRLWNIKKGVLCQTSIVDAGATYLEFSKDGSFLHSNLGSLHIRSKHFNYFSRQPHPKISIIQQQWIKLNGQKVLWLPHEYRPSCSAVKDNVIALGHESGRVSFIGFRK